MTLVEQSASLTVNNTSSNSTGQFTEDENQTLMLLRTNKEKLLIEIQQIKKEITEVTSRINELQSEVDRHTEPKVLDAIELFNQGLFTDCFERLVNVQILTDADSPVEKANFLASNVTLINLEKFHKYLYKPGNQDVMREFLCSVPIEGLTLLDSVRKCFTSLMFNEAESDVITRIYKFISQSYFRSVIIIKYF